MFGGADDETARIAAFELLKPSEPAAVWLSGDPDALQYGFGLKREFFLERLVAIVNLVEGDEQIGNVDACRCVSNNGKPAADSSLHTAAIAAAADRGGRRRACGRLVRLVRARGSRQSRSWSSSRSWRR
jgi:hypothetical protein